MIPIHLDPASAQVALIGRNGLAVRRLAWLRAAKAAPDVWSDEPSAALTESAGAGLTLRLPKPRELERYAAIWIADLPLEIARGIAGAARAAGVLVNVEDVTSLSDFHTPAVVHRGKLTLTAGTGGTSPAVARAARERLEDAFPEDWADVMDDIAAARVALRARGASFDALVADARGRLTSRGLI